MNSVVILAAGVGSRCNLGYNKLLYKINGKMIIEYTMEKFKGYDVILTVSNDDFETFSKLFPNITIVIGGTTRQESVKNAVKVCKHENVLIHDGARMFVNDDVIKNVSKAIETSNAVVPCVAVKDSIKDINGCNLDRSKLFIAQTPQAVKKSLYLECVNEECTDDVTVIEKCGYNIVVVEGDYENIKITTAEDIKYAEFKLGG